MQMENGQSFTDACILFETQETIHVSIMKMMNTK